MNDLDQEAIAGAPGPENKQPRPARRVYHPPTLVEWGTLVDLTRNLSDPNSDDGDFGGTTNAV